MHGGSHFTRECPHSFRGMCFHCGQSDHMAKDRFKKQVMELEWLSTITLAMEEGMRIQLQERQLPDLQLHVVYSQHRVLKPHSQLSSYKVCVFFLVAILVQICCDTVLSKLINRLSFFFWYLFDLEVKVVDFAFSSQTIEMFITRATTFGKKMK